MRQKLPAMFILLILFCFSSAALSYDAADDLKKPQNLPGSTSSKPEFITFNLSQSEIGVIRTCFQQMDEQVKKLKASDKNQEAKELADHLDALRNTKFTKGTSSVSNTNYGYVYSGFDPQWVYLTDEFFKLYETQRNLAQVTRDQLEDWEQLTVLEQISVLIHERVHSSIQSRDFGRFILFDWNSGERDAFSIHYRRLKIFEAQNNAWKNVKKDEDSVMMDMVKSRLVLYGVLKDKTKTAELDQAVFGPGSRPQSDLEAYRLKYYALEEKEIVRGREEMPRFPAGADSLDKKKIEAWREACFKFLDPGRDGPREANKNECFSEVERIHQNNDILYCRTCNRLTKQYWIAQDSDLGAHWMCQCSTVTQIADLVRPDGKTYRQYAGERIALFNKMRQEINSIAEKVLQDGFFPKTR